MGSRVCACQVYIQLSATNHVFYWDQSWEISNNARLFALSHSYHSATELQFINWDMCSGARMASIAATTHSTKNQHNPWPESTLPFARISITCGHRTKQLQLTHHNMHMLLNVQQCSANCCSCEYKCMVFQHICTYCIQISRMSCSRENSWPRYLENYYGVITS